MAFPMYIISPTEPGLFPKATKPGIAAVFKGGGSLEKSER